MNHPCRIAIKCPGPQPGLEADSPITNFSSEYTDGPQFQDWKYPNIDVYDPRIPGWWSAQSCGLFTCISYVSQQDADDCAAALAWSCVLSPPPPTDPTPFCASYPAECTPPGPGIHTNERQEAVYTCSDGSTFTWVVEAGRIVSSSVSLANAIALQLANDRVFQRAICLGELNKSACLDATYSETVSAYGGDVYFLEISNGLLPDGLTATGEENKLTISGTASHVGTYFFKVRATGIIFDNVIEKDYFISVIGFTTTKTLPGIEAGSPFSAIIEAIGGTAPLTFTSANLPPGLTISGAGVISGTPTLAGNHSFEITATDALGASCTKTFELLVGCVFATTSLPTGATQVFYSQTLSVTGFTSAAVWSIIAGSLPDGLNLDASTGTISGTPDTAENKTFTVAAVENELVCSKELTIEIGLFTPIAWDPESVIISRPEATITYDLQSLSMMSNAYSQGVPDPPVASAYMGVVGWAYYKGPALNVRIIIAATASGDGTNVSQLTVSGSGVPVWRVNGGDPPLNVNATWVIPDTAGLTVSIKFEFATESRSSAGLTPGSAAMTATFSVN